jgi:hypothetical protein
MTPAAEQDGEAGDEPPAYTIEEATAQQARVSYAELSRYARGST